jgi:NDP-sugar pyrophosphorylase family protein
LLGTGGGVRNALSLLDPDGTDEPFLVLNGKLIFDFDAHATLDTFTSRYPDAVGAMVARPVHNAQSWGAVDVADDGQQRPQVLDILGPGNHMFCGVHVTRPSVVRRLPEGESCMIRQGYLPWLKRGDTVGAIVVNSSLYFAEHSTPERYAQSNFDLLGGTLLRHPPGVLEGIAPSARIHPSANVAHPVRIGAGVRIGERARVGPFVVIGKDAEVRAEVSLSRAVVWPHADVKRDSRDCIVTPTGSLALELEE